MRADRNAGDLHLDGTRTEMSRLSRSLRFAIAERIIAKPVGPDSLIGYLKTNYIPNAIRQFNGGKGRNEQVYIHTRTFIYKTTHMQSCSHVCNQCTYGTNHEQDKDYNRLFIMIVHTCT